MTCEAVEKFTKEIELIETELKQVERDLQELNDRKRDLVERKWSLKKALENRADTLSQKPEAWENGEYKWSKQLVDTLKSSFHLNAFRPLQLSAINAVLSGEDVILIMATGGGKSLCYQLPAVLNEGITLVVSPLVSLMEDQLMALKQLNIPAALLYSGTTREEATVVQNAMKKNRAEPGDPKLIFVTPEKLAKSKRFMANLEKMYKAGRFSLLAIGLTATATTHVITDVKSMLNVEGALVFRAGFNRANLVYEVEEKPSEGAAFKQILLEVIRKRFREQSGIVYCYSKKEAEELVEFLSQNGIPVGCYHGDMSMEDRSLVHRNWTDGSIQVIVATIAFGMGIDKPNVRFVIHHTLSKSMENYYQESGRAGRDNERAHCILYYRFANVFRQSSMVCCEKAGPTNLQAMVAYCVNIGRCRRKLIAEHFGETWQNNWCEQNCDICSGVKFHSSRVNVADHCRNLVKLLQNSKDPLTGIKLVELYLKEQKKSGGKESWLLAKSDCERVVALLLLEGYLKEHYHYTAYNICVYLDPGERCKILSDERAQIMIEWPQPVGQCSASSHADSGVAVKRKKRKHSDVDIEILS